MSWVAIRKELYEKIMNDPKYGKKFREIIDDFLKGRVRATDIGKIIKEYCEENGIETIGL